MSSKLDCNSVRTNSIADRTDFRSCDRLTIPCNVKVIAIPVTTGSNLFRKSLNQSLNV